MRNLFKRLGALFMTALVLAMPVQARQQIYGDFDVTGKFQNFNTADGSTPFTSGGVSGYVTGISRSTYPKTAAALAASMASGADNVFLFDGDSTTMGAGSGTSGQTLLVGARPNSWVSQLAKLSGLAGMVADNDSRFGSQNTTSTSVTYAQYDTGVSMTGSWVLSSSANYDSTGGGMYFANTASSTLSITPSGAFDSVDIYYVQNTTLGSIAVNVDGGATLTTINCAAGGLSYQKATVTGISNATHTLNLVTGNANQVYVSGVVFHNSAKKGLKFVQSGLWGRLINSFATTTNVWSPQNALAKLTPTTHFIQVTINDTNNATPVATYKASLDAYVKASLATGAEVILMMGWQSNTTSYPNAVYFQQYYDAVKAVATANGVGYIDLGSRQGSWAANNAVGEMADSAHPNASGYADEASFVLSVLRDTLVRQ